MNEPPQWAAPGAQSDGHGGSEQPPSQDGNHPFPVPPPQQPVTKPGVIPLRPLAVGEILDGAISFIRANPMATIGLSAAVAVVSQLIGIGARLLLGGAGEPTANPLTEPERYLDEFGRYAPSAAIGGFVWFIAVSILTGLLIVVLSQAALGKPMGIGEAWRSARPRLAGLIGISLLLGLALSAVLIIGFLPGLIAVAAGAGADVVLLLMVVGLIVGVVAVVYLAISWSLIAPVFMLEHAGAIAAFRRSRRLVAPQWWRIFGILVLTVLLATIIDGILRVPLSFAAIALSGGPAAGLTIAGQMMVAIGAVLANMLTTPFQAGVTGLVYFDQRMRREGLDITLQRAAGGR